MDFFRNISAFTLVMGIVLTLTGIVLILISRKSAKDEVEFDYRRTAGTQLGIGIVIFISGLYMLIKYLLDLSGAQ